MGIASIIGKIFGIAKFPASLIIAFSNTMTICICMQGYCMHSYYIRSYVAI